MKDDFEHSRGRWLDQEDLLAKLTGWGTTRQGHAIRRQYRDQLESIIAADRRDPRNRDLRRALRDGLNVDHLLAMGITAAAGAGIGVNDDGIKTFAIRRSGLVSILALSARSVTWNIRSVRGRLICSTSWRSSTAIKTDSNAASNAIA